jgi:transcriptional regulator with XRE-family HTH domain
MSDARWIIKDLAARRQEEESGVVASLRQSSISKATQPRESVAFRRVAVQLGRRVRSLRQELGWSVEKAAERFGIEPAHVRRVEAGRTNPSLATLVGIAQGLSTDVVDLLGERTERTERTERGERAAAKTRKHSDVIELLGERVERGDRLPTKTRK